MNTSTTSHITNHAQCEPYRIAMECLHYKLLPYNSNEFSSEIQFCSCRNIQGTDPRAIQDSARHFVPYIDHSALGLISIRFVSCYYLMDDSIRLD